MPIYIYIYICNYKTELHIYYITMLVVISLN